MSKKSTKSDSKKQSDLEIRAVKKSEVLGEGTRKKGWSLAVIIIGLAVMIAAAGWLLGISMADRSAIEAAPPKAAEPASGHLTYPVADFEDRRARYYSHETSDGITIRFFIIKSSDGVIRAAYDACDVCWRAGKGYSQDGDVMVCNNCSRRFASVKINEIQGGCNPAPLTRAVEGDRIIIKVPDILKGRQYFDFSS